MFIGRKRELDALNGYYQQNGFQMPVIYGRRRVGKSRLIREFCLGKRAFIYVGLEQSKENALRSFSEAALTQLPSQLTGQIRSFENWTKAFHYLTEFAKNERLVVVIDEYPYLAKSDPSLASTLQFIIDTEWKETQMYLILCGSSMSFMESDVLAYKSPLYGRRTAQFKLQAMPYWDCLSFFKGWSWEEQLYAYGICGGIPQYLEAFARHSNLRAAVLYELLTPSGMLIEEPANLIRQEMREPALYNSIISAIANGASKLNEIATSVHKESRELTTYLRALQSLGLVEKLTPISEKKSKKTIYRLSDNLYRFWHRFIPDCLPLISLGLPEEAWSSFIEPNLPEYFGRIFETVSLQYVQKLVMTRRIPNLYTQFGSWWGSNPKLKREEEIDIVALAGQQILVGECKWRNELTGIDTLATLQERSRLIPGQRKAVYYLFSKSDFTDDLKKQASENIVLVRAQEMTKD